MTISIHALVKRATVLLIRFPPSFSISIHALVKRATPGKTAVIIDHVDFNPRPREEGDRLYSLLDEDTGISIHALVKRATNALGGE